MTEPIHGEAARTSTASSGHCRRLRCKEMFIETSQLFDIASTGSGAYWCAHTQNCLGPDGETAEPSSCKAGRGCFEAL